MRLKITIFSLFVLFFLGCAVDEGLEFKSDPVGVIVDVDDKANAAIDRAAAIAKASVGDAQASIGSVLAGVAEEHLPGPEAIRAITPLLPADWQGAAGWYTALLFALRAMYNRKAGRNIPRAIIEASHGGNLNLKDEETRAALSSSMGAGGKRLVDEAQGKRLSLPI